MTAPTLTILRNDAGRISAVQTEHVIAKRTSKGAIVWRPSPDAVIAAARADRACAHLPHKAAPSLVFVRAALLILAPELEGHNLSHSAPAKLTGYRTVTDLDNPPTRAAVEPVPAVLYEGLRCDDCGGPLTDRGAHGIGCEACADAEEDGFANVPAPRPTPMLPRAIVLDESSEGGVGRGMFCRKTSAAFIEAWSPTMSSDPLAPIRASGITPDPMPGSFVSSETLSALANLEAGETRDALKRGSA